MGSLEFTQGDNAYYISGRLPNASVKWGKIDKIADGRIYINYEPLSFSDVFIHAHQAYNKLAAMWEEKVSEYAKGIDTPLKLAEFVATHDTSRCSKDPVARDVAAERFKFFRSLEAKQNEG